MRGRYFLELSYRGGAYHGWQKQDNAYSVQEAVEKSLRTLTGGEVAVTASGRTDSGVHASQQFVHADLKEPVDSKDLLYRMNAVLPSDIAVKSIMKATEDAHARFSAVSRSYRYEMHSGKDPFLHELSCYYPHPLDMESMNSACRFLLGERDFRCFSKARTAVNNFRCNISEAYWLESGERRFFHITANRFLRGMVRAIVGAMLDVGRGRTSPEYFNAIIERMDRQQAGKAAPACGLYLSNVKYPPEIFMESI